MDINTDPSCSKTVDPDKVPGSSLGLDAIMALVGQAGQPGQHGPSGSMILKCQLSLGGSSVPEHLLGLRGNMSHRQQQRA